MARLRLHALVWGALAQTLGSFACSDDEQAAVSLSSDAGDDGATGGNSTSTGGGGSGGAETGGTSNQTGGAGNSADASTAGSGGVGVGGNNSGGQLGSGGDAGGGDASTSVALSVCVRLQSPSVLSFDVTRTYDHTVYADCRVKWVANLYLDVDQREVFLNNLLAWNMRFWGCTPPPPDNFALIFKPAPLTSADAAALIDDYVDVATQALGLSAPEITEMRAALTNLAKSTIATVSGEYSHSQCASDAGAGGTDGGGASSAGGTGGTSTGSGGTGGASPDAAPEAGQDAATDASSDTGRG